MGYLLDTHIFIALIENRFEELPQRVRTQIERSGNDLHLSISSLWEIAIKYRLGKLPLKATLESLPDAARQANIQLLSITERHALAHVEPEPPTRDPFDRLLLAQCLIEDMKLVTIDAALAGHPLSATA